MSKLYGNLMNRLAEDRGNEQDRKVGEDITKYYWSDRDCYYITRVIDNKHIFVKPYEVCPDYSKGPMSNEWMYFKTRKERNAYQNAAKLTDCDGNIMHFIEEPDESEEQEWVFRYNNWYIKCYDYEGKPIYRKLEKISFGVRDYYYDYEF